MVAIREATPADLFNVLAKPSKEAKAELDANGVSAAEFVAGLERSVVSGTVVVDSEPIAVFGCTPSLHGAGIPWMVETDEMRRHPVAIAKLSVGVIDSMLKHFRHLHNLVHRDHHVAIEWLRWLGFHVEREPVGPGGQFLYFWRSECAAQ